MWSHFSSVSDELAYVGGDVAKLMGRSGPFVGTELEHKSSL